MDYLKESAHRSFLIRDLLGLGSEKGRKPVSKNFSPVESVCQINSATIKEIDLSKYSTSNLIEAHQQPNIQLHHGNSNLSNESRAIYKMFAGNCLPINSGNVKQLSFIGSANQHALVGGANDLAGSCYKGLNNQPLALLASSDQSEQVNINRNKIPPATNCGAKNNQDHILQSRRNRTIFYEYQLIGLERRFDSNKYLTTADRIKIAKMLNLSQLQVKTWYQNRRMKWKKQIMMGGSKVSPTKPKGRPRKDSIPYIEDLND